MTRRKASEQEGFIAGLASGRLDNERGMWRTCAEAMGGETPYDEGYDRGYAMYEPTFAWIPHGETAQ